MRLESAPEGAVCDKKSEWRRDGRLGEERCSEICTDLRGSNLEKAAGAVDGLAGVDEARYLGTGLALNGARRGGSGLCGTVFFPFRWLNARFHLGIERGGAAIFVVTLRKGLKKNVGNGTEGTCTSRFRLITGSAFKV